MSHHPSSAPWTIVVYRVSALERQQRILRAFHRMDRLGVVALGTQTDGAWFVVVECPGASAEMYVRRVVLTIDPYAVATHSTRSASATRGVGAQGPDSA